MPHQLQILGSKMQQPRKRHFINPTTVAAGMRDRRKEAQGKESFSFSHFLRMKIFQLLTEKVNGNFFFHYRPNTFKVTTTAIKNYETLTSDFLEFSKELAQCK